MATAKKPKANPSKNRGDATVNYLRNIIGTRKDAGQYGPKSAAKASAKAIVKTKTRVSRRQASSASKGRATGRMGSEGRYSSGEARPRTGKSPDYGEE